MKKFDVLLAGYFGFGNLGDELLLSSALDYLETAGVKKDRVAVLSRDPGETSATFGVEAFGRELFSLPLSRALSASRSLIFPGGGIFQDSSSVRSCFYYWGLARKAISHSCRLAAISQSIGPLSNKLSKKMTRDALSRCRYLSVRDETSIALSRELGLHVESTPDLVMGLKIPELPERSNGAALINIRPVRGSDACARTVLKAARAFASEGIPIRGTAFAREDELELKRYIRSGELPKCDVALVKNLNDFLSVSQDAFAAVGMRLHFGILSLKRGLGVAIAPYDPKVSDFAGKWGAKCPELNGIKKNSDIMRVLTKALFEDKKQPDHEKVRRAISGAFKNALSRVLEDG
ncbi:MAG: polysaccharide pyruvyl transferase family protein [Synergistaceae bacterium]|jgi:polysaccharide pyruvyl transferase CsaB|nr:polysaccharide pyruvyl transferase family protein [Synergistaceae bacterium]